MRASPDMSTLANPSIRIPSHWAISIEVHPDVPTWIEGSAMIVSVPPGRVIAALAHSHAIIAMMSASPMRMLSVYDFMDL